MEYNRIHIAKLHNHEGSTLLAVTRNHHPDITYNINPLLLYPIQYPRQHLIKFPTIILGMPHLSRLIVNEKQQFTKPCSLGASSFFCGCGCVLMRGL